MWIPVKTISLAQLATHLDTSEDPAMGILKTVLLRDAPAAAADLGTLALANVEEVAHFLAVSVVLASESNGKDELKALKQSFDGAELDQKYMELSAAHPHQSLNRNKKGELVIDAKDGIPVFELDGRKVAPILRNAEQAFAAAGKLDLNQLVQSKAFIEALGSRVSHPTKLSAPSGAGGFLKVESSEMPADFGFMTEADFVTRETVTLACSAGYQKLWVVLLPLFEFDDKTVRLAALMASNPDVAGEVCHVLIAHGVTQGPALVYGLSRLTVGKVSGEPQVFCGDLPAVERLSVLAPYGLFNEFSRAKRALQAEHDSDREQDVALLDEEIALVEKDLNALAPAGTSRDEKRRVAEIKDKLTARIKQLKADQNRLTSAWLSIPCFPLMFGGANPRNMAMDLDTSLHAANVQVYVPSPRLEVHQASARAFVASAMVTVPKLRPSAELPAFLTPRATGGALKKARNDFFAQLISAAMAPAKELQEEWQSRSKAFVGEVTLSAAAQDQVLDGDGPWNLFLKGSETLNNKEAMAQLAPVLHDIGSAVRKALQAAFGDNTPSTFDGEMNLLVANAVALERA